MLVIPNECPYKILRSSTQQICKLGIHNSIWRPSTKKKIIIVLVYMARNEMLWGPTHKNKQPMLKLVGPSSSLNVKGFNIIGQLLRKQWQKYWVGGACGFVKYRIWYILISKISNTGRSFVLLQQLNIALLIIANYFTFVLISS